MKELKRLLFWAVAGIVAMVLSVVFSSCRTRTVYTPIEMKVLDSIVYHLSYDYNSFFRAKY